MLRQPTHLTGLLSAVLFAAGLAVPITLADDPVESEQTVEQVQPADESNQSASTKAESPADVEKEAKEEMIEVRISMPDGRTIIRYEPARRTSAKRSFISIGSVSKILPDGSRISYGTGGVVGGTNASSVRSGGGGSSRGGGGGGGSSGGGGGASSGVATISRGGGLGSADIESESESESVSQALGASTDSSSSAVDDDLFDGSTVNTYAGSNASNNADSSTNSSESSSNANTDSTDTRSVPTIGDPEYTDDRAIGGQRAEFHDAGIGAAVIGNTVYFIGVELVQANQPFEIVSGTRIGADSAILLESRPSSGGDLLNDWNTAASPIKLDFESNTIVDLVMLTVPTDSSNPIRVQRTWTVRIR